MTMIDGSWDSVILTPIGRVHVTFQFTRAAGALTGTASSRGETVGLHDIVEHGERVTWRQQVTKPLRLNLDFDVTVTGDVLEGHSKAGRLPSSPVTGTRL
jgi:hypothetical protein